MKKILLFLFLGVAAMAVTPAHSQITLVSQLGNVSDTLGASDTTYLRTVASLSGVGLSGKYVIELTVVSLSGTVSGTFTLEGSMIGGTGATATVPWAFSNGWSTGINKVPGVNGTNCDTLTVSSAGTYYITISPNAPKQAISASGVNQTYYTAGGTRRYYIRLKGISPTGSQSTKVSAKLITLD